MDVGLTIPTRGPLAAPANIETLVRRAEELGFDHLSVSDHLVVPRNIDSRYPYSESGAWPGAASGECLEQFTLLAWLAAITETPALAPLLWLLPLAVLCWGWSLPPLASTTASFAPWASK